MINSYPLPGAWILTRAPMMWARWANSSHEWCARLWLAYRLPREFKIDERPDAPGGVVVTRLPLAMGQIWELIREGHLGASSSSAASLPWLQPSIPQGIDAVSSDRMSEETVPATASNVIPLPLLQLAETDAEALWNMIEVTERFGDWGAEMGQLLRQTESLVDRHEGELRPELVSRANWLMSELRDGLLTENRVIVHMRGRELSRLLARLRDDIVSQPAQEPERHLACVGA